MPYGPDSTIVNLLQGPELQDKDYVTLLEDAKIKVDAAYCLLANTLVKGGADSWSCNIKDVLSIVDNNPLVCRKQIPRELQILGNRLKHNTFYALETQIFWVLQDNRYRSMTQATLVKLVESDPEACLHLALRYFYGIEAESNLSLAQVYFLKLDQQHYQLPYEVEMVRLMMSLGVAYPIKRSSGTDDAYLPKFDFPEPSRRDFVNAYAFFQTARANALSCESTHLQNMARHLAPQFRKVDFFKGAMLAWHVPDEDLLNAYFRVERENYLRLAHCFTYNLEERYYGIDQALMGNIGLSQADHNRLSLYLTFYALRFNTPAALPLPTPQAEEGIQAPALGVPPPFEKEHFYQLNRHLHSAYVPGMVIGQLQADGSLSPREAKEDFDIYVNAYADNVLFQKAFRRLLGKQLIDSHRTWEWRETNVWEVEDYVLLAYLVWGFIWVADAIIMDAWLEQLPVDADIFDLPGFLGFMVSFNFVTIGIPAFIPTFAITLGLIKGSDYAITSLIAYAGSLRDYAPQQANEMSPEVVQMIKDNDFALLNP